MKLHHFGQSCVLIESKGARILLDPGSFSAAAQGLESLDAILVTHQHADHMDADLIGALMSASPGAKIYAEAGTAAALAESGLDAATLKPGDEATIGAVGVRAVGGAHAVIHADMPAIGNIGLVLSTTGEKTLGFTGDSNEVIDEFVGIDALLFAVNAPWSKVGETIDFLRAVRPVIGIPVHDEIVSVVGRAMHIGHVTDFSDEATEIRDWTEGQTLEL